MKPVLKALLLVYIFNTALAQSRSLRTFTLPAAGTQSIIHQLYQDSSGYLLVAASTGLYRFDGASFYRFAQDKAVPDDVTAVYQANDHRTWLGFANGKLGWLHKNRMVLQDPEEGLPAKAIKKIIQDKAGVVWIATAGEGVYYFTGNRFYNINADDGLSDNYVYDLVLDNNTVLAATDRGINQLSLEGSRKRVKTYTSREGLPDNIILSLHPVQHAGSHQEARCFWMAMQDGGTGIYCPAAGTASATPNWSYGQVNSLLQSAQSLYLGAEEQGLLRFDIGRNNRLQRGEIIYPSKVSSLLADAEGNVWAAGNDQLIRSNGSKLLALAGLDQATAEGLHALLVDKQGRLWMNVPRGLKRLEKDGEGNWIERVFRLPLSINSHITALYEDRFGHIWIGTMGNGAFLLDAATGRFRQLTEDRLLASASVLSITGKENDVWIASLEGAVHATLTEKNTDLAAPLATQDLTAISGLGTNYIYHIFIDSRGRTWFATDGKGLALYEKGRFTSYDQRHGLKSQVVYQVAEDNQGNIWFTTFNSGLVKFNGKTFRHFTTADGLSDLTATSLASDQQGKLYLSHRKGIDVIDTRSGAVSYLDEEQGIDTVNTDLNTIQGSANGDIYFISGNTIYRYAARGINDQPKIVIDRVQLFLSDADVENGHEFSSHENNISFYYTGLYYSQPGRIQYQYRLDGFGEEWITTKDRRRDFPRLGPGNYTFRVRASLNRNFSNAAEASFSFTIATPLWLRWWFIAIVLLVIALLLYYYIRLREKRLQKLERLEKEKIQSQFETLRNQVNPHFLFNSFNTLVSEIEEDPKRAVQYVEHMADFFRSIVTYREKDIISLGEEIHIIKDYLFIQRKRYGDAFRVNIDISPAEEESYFLAPLTLQLLAENAIKHNAVMREKPLLLEIFVEADQLVVRNNVNPRLHREKSAGLGLQNIYRRYELLTRKTVAVSNDDEYFTVIIPLIKKADVSNTDSGR